MYLVLDMCQVLRGTQMKNDQDMTPTLDQFAPQD